MQRCKKYTHCSCTTLYCLCVCVSVGHRAATQLFSLSFIGNRLEGFVAVLQLSAAQLIRLKISQALTWAASERPHSLWGPDVRVTQIWTSSFLDQVKSQMTDRLLRTTCNTSIFLKAACGQKHHCLFPFFVVTQLWCLFMYLFFFRKVVITSQPKLHLYWCGRIFWFKTCDQPLTSHTNANYKFKFKMANNCNNVLHTIHSLLTVHEHDCFY